MQNILKRSYFEFDKSTKSQHSGGEGGCALHMLCMAKKNIKQMSSWPIYAKTPEPRGEQASHISMGLEHKIKLGLK